MSYRYEQLTVSRVIDLISADGVYYLGYSFLFGMSVWVNFIGGVIAYRALRMSHSFLSFLLETDLLMPPQLVNNSAPSNTAPSPSSSLLLKSSLRSSS